MAYTGAEPLPVFAGGTGRATLTAHDVLVGDGTSPVTLISPSTSGFVLTSNGVSADPTFQAPATSGTVTSVSVVSANGFAGTVATATTTPAITLTTTATGVLQGNGTAISAVTGANDGILITSNTGVVSWLTNGTTGQVLTATTGNPPSWSNASASSITFTGDTGTPFSTSSVTIEASTSSQNCGSSVSFNAATPNVQLNVTDASNNTIVGKGAGNATLSGASNTGFGLNVLAGLTSGITNVAIGNSALKTATSGSDNIAIGPGALQTTTNGIHNIAIGQTALTNATTGIQFNTALGYNGLSQLLTGTINTALGYDTGSQYTGSESHNILIRNTGVVGDNNVLRIGTQGTGSGQQNACFMAGITGVSVSNQTIVTLNSSTGQLGEVSTVPVANGGTGAATLTGLLIGNGTSAVTTQTFVAPGTWTPVLTIGGSSTGITYSSQLGYYMQIGTIVFFNIFLVMTSKGGLSGNCVITGFPVSAGSNAASYNIICVNMQNCTLTALYTNIFGFMSGTTMNLVIQGSAQAAANLTGAMLANNSIMAFNGWYATN